MCGLVYVKRKDGHPAYKAVLKRYRNQKHRGQSGFGYVAIHNNQVVSYERAPTEHEIIQKIARESAEEILFHHRLPTSTPNVVEAAHPFLIENPKLLDHQYLVAHNGVITNCKELKKVHEKMGFTYQTEMFSQVFVPASKTRYEIDSKFNDSEAIAIETALVLEGKKGFIDTEGAAAVIGFQVQNLQVLSRFFYRNLRHPLVYKEDSHMITLTSLGKEMDVPSHKILHLKPSSGYEMHPADVLSPPSYKPSAYTPPVRDFRGNTPWGAATHNATHEWTPRLGYGRDDERIGNALLEIDQEMKRLGDIGSTNLDIPYDDSVDDDLDERIGKDIRRIVKTMSDNALWVEWNKCVSIEDAVKAKIAETEHLLMGKPEDPELIVEEEELSYQKSQLNIWMKDLSDEMEFREMNSSDMPLIS